MPYADLDIAGTQCQAAREVVLFHDGGRHDEPTLHRLQQMLQLASAAVGDGECKSYFEAALRYAKDLFSDSAHEKWARASTSGTDFLRLQILRELDNAKQRLAEIEAMRSSAGREDDSGKYERYPKR